MFAIGPAAFALLSAVYYGAGDFLGGRASIRLPVLTTMLIAQIAACSIALTAVGGLPSLSVSAHAMVLGAIGGLCHVAAVGFLYHGLAHGRVCIIAPVSGVLNIAVPVLVDGVVINGLGLVQGMGILMAAAAVGLVSCCGQPGLGRTAKWPRLDLVFGVASGILFGIADLSLGSVAPEAAGDAVLAARLVGMTGVALAFLVVNAQAIASALAQAMAPAAAAVSWQRGLTPEARLGIGLALMAGAGDCIGHLSYTMSAAMGELSVAVATSALFPAVSVLLAILLLKERIGRTQSLGLAVSAGSVILLAGA